MAHTVILKFRTRAGKASRCRKSGGCLSTSLAVAYSQGNDPAITFPIKLIYCWGRIDQGESGWKEAIDVVWDKTRDKLVQMNQGRWNGVHGHIGAVVATLLDLGWSPRSPLRWTDDQDVEWILYGAATGLKGDLQQIIGDSIQRKLWKTASKA